ncbi:MAG: FMN-binding glutamate synthase family protein [Pseudomonadales bacterium]|jgi:glutamate synthase domain-containing protein 2|nr:FMN-binding glutamate synthase family protein [Pseudomonadales bacterium]
MKDGIATIFDSITALTGTLVVLGLVAIGVLLFASYLADLRQTQHTIRRNFPLVGRARYWLESLGTFLRQYFFAMDREEMPFNRAQRSWVYRAAKNLDNTVGFGSTKNVSTPGAVTFLNTPFPELDTEAAVTTTLRIGPYCRTPYDAPHFFNISGMSFGALSRVAIEALSLGAKRAGCWLNTGEGGLSPYHLSAGCDIVFQIGTAKYGVRDAQGRLSPDRLREIAALPQVRMIEVKLSQGAKPGKGGILPAHKVTPEIAATRGIPAGEASISPNRHPEIGSAAELLDFIAQVRDLSGKPCGIKLVLGSSDWLGQLCDEIHRRGIESAPDFITVDSGDGGTGAAPMPLIDDVGLLLRESLPMVVDTLVEAGLRERVRVIASGKLVTPTEVATALCTGADFCVTARGFMFSLGCIQALQCNRNTCPTGITTHDPRLQRGLVPAEKSERVAHYHANLVKEVETIAHSCGVREPREFRRHHVRVMTDSGKSMPLSVLYPDAEPIRLVDAERQAG